MIVNSLKTTVRELVDSYQDDGEGGVRACGGLLDVRPPYQREFVYKDKKRDAVIDTVQKGFPLNVMYWADLGEGRYEIIDGQQRTISICQYVHGQFSIDGLFFHNLQTDQQDRILDYELMVYVCEGTDSEKLDWFEIVNIAGERLFDQELRNAVYHGPWLGDAKSRFSRRNCPAEGVAGKYLKGSAIRQEYLETAIRWISDGKIEEYMGRHQHDSTAVALWNHFRSVIDWVKATFTVYRKEMMGVDWGPLYNHFKDADLDPAAIEEETAKLMEDEHIDRKAGIYPYLLDRDERHLKLRSFSKKIKREVFEAQKGVCRHCGETFRFEEMEGDHIDPWSEGGQTTADNCQMLCKPCNRRKGAR